MTIDKEKLVVREVILPTWPGIAGKRVKAVLLKDIEDAENKGTWKWDTHYGEWACSECGKACAGYTKVLSPVDGSERKFLPEFCSYCGAQMHDIEGGVRRDEV